MSIFRVFVEKKPEFSSATNVLKQEIADVLGIDIAALRLFIRYDAEGISRQEFERAVPTVFSQAAADNVYLEQLPKSAGTEIFAVSPLPGQYDQRADSAEQCVQLLTQGAKPTIKTAIVYAIDGINGEQLAQVKSYLVNPVECEIVPLEKPETLKTLQGSAAEEIIHNEFLPLTWAQLEQFHNDFGFAMTLADLQVVQDYFKSISRAPTHTELKVIDTYWSDHCRHTTFLTQLDKISFSGDNSAVRKSFQTYLQLFDELYAGRDDKYISLMDMATIGAKKLKIDGYISDLDESEEINACSVRVVAEVDGREQHWLVMFKNETHNHPTEIEPYGGAATCLGGAIRDPLSGRAYVYQAMRVTGCADPFTSAKDTPRGKLLQRVITTTAAKGFASYGNQIGLATGIVSEIYHNSYIAKRMEAGFVVAAAPAENVVREKPQAGDKIILLGGDTGRDGCGGATGSSKAHREDSVTECGAEVQKGNPVIERKIQRLMRNKNATTLIKRCNDFGAGGVCVAIGELADSLEIDLNAVPLKYQGLSGTEIAISESQERMAMVIAPQNVDRFIQLAAEENLNAVAVATVTDSGKLIMRHNGKSIVELDRTFLNTNGADQHAVAEVCENVCDYRQTVESSAAKAIGAKDYKTAVLGELARLNVCSSKGLTEMFDSTIGSGTIYLPLGGKNQLTPAIAMAAKLPAEGETDDCTVASSAFYPHFSEQSPYSAAHYAVIGSVAKLVACGAQRDKIRLSFQEYFPRLGDNPRRWGLPVAALLGALSAQLGLKTPSIGGKDSMSGSFEDYDVVPTLISFAIAHHKASALITNVLSAAGKKLYRLKVREHGGMPDYVYLCAAFDAVSKGIALGIIDYATVVEEGGAVCAVIKSCLGGGVGCDFVGGEQLFSPNFGEIIFAADDVSGFAEFDFEQVGITTDSGFSVGGEVITFDEAVNAYTATLAPIFPIDADIDSAKAMSTGSQVIADKTSAFVKSGSANANKHLDNSGNLAVNIALGARPKVLLPVFPGTNCEYDTYAKFLDAGGDPEMFIIKNRTTEEVKQSAVQLAALIDSCNILAIPGGFSGGDEPAGSGKFIATMFRNPIVMDSVLNLYKNRDGLILGICNGFQALIKLSLVPYGEILDQKSDSPTLTHNTLPGHKSRICKVRVNSAMSPWLSAVSAGEVYDVVISHGEGRFVCTEQQFKDFNARGMIATQYCDKDGNLSMSGAVNPNGSAFCVEGITSPCGRILGKMGHSERVGDNLYKNYPGNFDMKIFESGIKYFK